MAKAVTGFSKKTKEEKIEWLIQTYLANDSNAKGILTKYWNSDSQLQKLHDDFIENTLSNYYLPFAVAPNFMINGNMYALPMVIEESSVVAAASNSAKFWMERGGFRATVLSTQKSGQVHFNYSGSKQELVNFFNEVKPFLIESLNHLQAKMKDRGGGLVDIILEDHTQELNDYYLLNCTFETADAMGANFINSCLEEIARKFEELSLKNANFKEDDSYPDVILSILSNYVPNCLVTAEVSCKVNQLNHSNIDGLKFAKDFVRAVDIAKVEPRRAVTHNKGIMNGIDAVVLATGNDFRAVEAGVHAYASKSGKYSSLTNASIENGVFTFSINIPLALGTVGGLTSLHPLVKLALDLLQNPSAKELMEIVAVAGLAQNFAALRSLVTTGIQKGHMKMHLLNILNQIEANEAEKEQAVEYFNDRLVSHSAVISYVEKLRN